jgi:O-antigen/teichoic acid export membrane protein
MRRFYKGVLGARTGQTAVTQTLFANLLIQLTNIGCGILTARLLGPSGRGTLAAIILWPAFLAYALTLGIPVASVYYIRRSPEMASATTAMALLSGTVMGLVASCIGIMIIPHSLHAYSHQVIHFAQRAVLAAPLSLLGITLQVQAQSANSFRRYNVFRLTPQVLILIALCLEWKLGKLNVYSASLAYLLAGVPVTIWNFIWVWQYFRPRFTAVNQVIRDLTSYGLRAWGADLLGSIASQVDRLLVVSLLAPDLMGMYVVAQSAANLLNVLPSAMVPVLLPTAADRSMSEIVTLTGRAARVTLVALLIAALPLLTIGGFLLHLVYGNRFDGASGVLRLLVAESVLDGVTGVLSQAFLAAGCPGTVAVLQGSGLASAVPLLVWLVPMWGLNGAGAAILLSTTLRLCFVLANFPLRLKMRPPSLLLRPSELAALYGAL